MASLVLRIPDPLNTDPAILTSEPPSEPLTMPPSEPPSVPPRQTRSVIEELESCNNCKLVYDWQVYNPWTKVRLSRAGWQPVAAALAPHMVP